MTNIEKVKRILDSGHWVKVTYEIGVFRYGITTTFTSYHEDRFSYIKDGCLYSHQATFKDCTIEVIQRIPTHYKAGDKVLVLSNPSPTCSDSKYIDMMVGNVCEIKNSNGFSYAVYDEDKTDYWVLPSYCLAPAFDEDSLSGKEAKITIDGKEYTAVIK